MPSRQHGLTDPAFETAESPRERVRDSYCGSSRVESTEPDWESQFGQKSVGESRSLNCPEAIIGAQIDRAHPYFAARKAC